MNLGSSLRRRRGGERSSRARGGAGRSGGSGWRFPDLAGHHWLLAAGAAALVLGSGGGYLYATQVAFPASEVLVEDFREVPDVRRLSLEESRSALGPVDLETGRIDSIRHPEVPSGLVVGQTPLPGQLAVVGGAVDLTLSLGPERRPVPDVSRLLASRAVTVLETTGFEVEVDSVEADVSSGRVVETEPLAGEELELPSLVRVTVSLGPPLVELPDLLGMQEGRAREVLDSLGFELEEVEEVYRFGGVPGAVIEQTPEGGQEIPLGSVVRLSVGREGFFRNRDGDGALRLRPRPR